MTGRHFVQWFGGAALLAVGKQQPARADLPESAGQNPAALRAGGVADITHRVVAQKLSQSLGQQVPSRTGPARARGRTER